MSKTVIKIENLSKVYRLGEIGTGTLSHDLNRWWKMNIRGQEDPFAKVGHVNDRTTKATKGELVAALSDINLEVKQGEVLGIIGRNGAGKSTLLKILSRVTSPTTGSIKVKGRMASLLEVGTGFHPEMTGRENIYMNGTIMGMRRWEIDKQLDEIVEFAGVAKYLDTPVKRYSSGMTVRLGFAIAAHLEPEILIVDEVLAVGDAEFQKKAIGKMQDVSTSDGRTVLFVSHNMDSILKLCTKAILLNDGLLIYNDKVRIVIDQYVKKIGTHHFYRNTATKIKPVITEVMLDQEEIKKGIFKVDVSFESPFELRKPNVGIVIYTMLGSPIYGTNSKIHSAKNHSNCFSGKAILTIPFPFHSSSYKFSVFLGDTQIDYDSIEDAINFDYISPMATNNIYDVSNIGALNAPADWEYINLR